jgi:multicomponent Na+:H+ antiporter subunit D
MLLEVFIVLGCISMLVGVLLALYQWDYKRLLAYHSISQVGYIILSLGLGTPLGILGGLFHLINHSIFKSLLFLTSGAVEYATGTRDLQKMGGLRQKMPVTAMSAFVGAMSIAGVPPFNGFWSKLIIILACIQAGRYWVAAMAVIGSLLTLSSFLKVQKYAFFGELKPEHEGVKEVPVSMQIAMVFLAILCILTSLLILPSVREFLLEPAVQVVVKGLDYGKNVMEVVK